MKRVRINAGYVGLVFKRGAYEKVLTTGTHWLIPYQKVLVYDLSKPFYATVAQELLLEDENLRAMLHEVVVADGEITVVIENGNFKQVLQPGRHLFWNALITYEFITVDLSKINITEPLEKAVLTKLGGYIRLFEVAVYEKAVLLIDDVYQGILEGGTYRYWRNETTIKIAKADMRQLQLEIAGQELLTKDKAAIRINFYTQYKVTDVEKALLGSKDYEKQLYIAMQLVLRAYVGSYTLDEMLEGKESIAEVVFEDVRAEAEKLGVTVLNCGIRDVILTGEMKEIMNQVLVAQKRAQANTITRREETASTRSLLNTAKLMEENEMLFKLKEMEYVEKIAEKIGEITVNGNGGVVHQLQEIFSVRK
ncbi:slipin family protein [Ascidiimonas sp. W6]|uniref:slipin family protein n=1 Tax=Ascidiimonas meishanensis TaxID=3128903 RepID=UPI0030ED0871